MCPEEGWVWSVVLSEPAGVSSRMSGAPDAPPTDPPRRGSPLAPAPARARPWLRQTAPAATAAWDPLAMPGGSASAGPMQGNLCAYLHRDKTGAGSHHHEQRQPVGARARLIMASRQMGCQTWLYVQCIHADADVLDAERRRWRACWAAIGAVAAQGLPSPAGAARRHRRRRRFVESPLTTVAWHQGPPHSSPAAPRYKLTGAAN